MNLSRVKAVFFIILLLTSGLNSLTAQTNKQTSNDIKIRQRFTSGGQSFEQVRYIKGARERNESSMEGMPTTIWQCDTKRYIRINDKTKTYKIDESETNNTSISDKNTSKGSVRGGVITYNYHRVDTGERKQMFGYTAYHIKTTIEIIPSADACSKSTMKMQQDGWYIDIDNGGADCNMGAYNQSYNGGMGSGCADKVKMNFTGTQNYRFPLDETTTMDVGNGSTYTTRTEVLELSRAQLSASLFDIPEGYTEVEEAVQLIGMNTGKQMSTTQSSQSPNVSMIDDSKDNGIYSPNNTQKTLPPSMSNNSSVPTVAKGAKLKGVIRIGVVMPKVQTTSGADMTNPIRNSVLQYLSRPAVEVTTLDANNTAQIELEAKQKECDFILYMNVNHKKGGGGFGGMFGNISPVLNQVPIGGVGNKGTAVAGQVATTAVITAASMSSNVQNKDEVTIEYQLLSSANNSQVVANKLKAKAKSDGEDIFSGLLEQMATVVLSAAIKR